MLKIGLIEPPIIGNSVRGVGFYQTELTTHLQKIRDLKLIVASRKQLPVNCDLLHFLYFDPFFLTLPVKRPAKTIVTVFDLTPIVLSDKFPRGIRGEIKWQIQKQLLGHVDRIITSSNSSKADIVRLTGYPKEKISVTYLAAGDNYQPIPRTNLTEVKKKYHLGEKFVLYIGDINANKNLLTLISAFSQLKSKKSQLVLSGKSFTADNLPESRAIRSSVAKLNLTSRVIFPGFISEEDKISLLNLATVYVQPSIYEGFGIPVVEAMACGTPVICGQNSSFPEIAGEAAVYADVTNSSDLASKIDRLLDMDSRERAVLSKKSLDQAGNFSWENTAERTYEVYKKVLNGL